MLLIPIALIFAIGLIILILNVIIPYRENIRKETYKNALNDCIAEKKESEN